ASFFPYFFFFFQAEDGIRDFHVTGVQTCALPISRYMEHMMALLLPSIRGVQEETPAAAAARRAAEALLDGAEPERPQTQEPDARSEERRVGKECRPRGGRDRQRKHSGGRETRAGR